jgi:hypothetical protein
MCFSPKMPDIPPPPPPPAPPPPPLAMAERATPVASRPSARGARRRGTQQLTARRRPTIGAGMGGGTGVQLPQ